MISAHTSGAITKVGRNFVGRATSHNVTYLVCVNDKTHGSLSVGIVPIRYCPHTCNKGAVLFFGIDQSAL